MIAPPRTAESLLEALGASAKFGDALLGDLAEEFAARAERDGIVAAKRWYRAEAARSAPHLLWNWLRRLNGQGVRHIAGVAITAYTLVAVVVGILLAIVASFMHALNAGPLFRGPLSPSGEVIAIMLAVTVVEGMLGGYFAAWLDQRAPLASAIVLGVLWAAFGAVLYVIIPGAPGPMRWGTPIAVLVGTLTGGSMRVATTARPRGAAK